MNERYKILTVERNYLSYYDNLDYTHALRLKLLEMGLSFTGISKVENGKKLQCFLVEKISPESFSQLKEALPQVQDTPGKFYPSSKKEAEAKQLYLTFWEDGKEYYYVAKQEKVNEQLVANQ